MRELYKWKEAKYSDKTRYDIIFGDSELYHATIMRCNETGSVNLNCDMLNVRGSYSSNSVADAKITALEMILVVSREKISEALMGRDILTSALIDLHSETID